MAKLEFGERIGKTAKLSPAVSGFVFNSKRELLLTQRTDNGRWCLPGGRIEPGENVSEAVVREIWEETGLKTGVVRVIGVTSDPGIIVTYPDGNRWQPIEIDIELRVEGGTEGNSDETTHWGYYSVDNLNTIDIMETELPRIRNALSGNIPYVY